MSLFLVSSVLLCTALVAAVHELVWLALERAGLAAEPAAPPPGPLAALPVRSAIAAAAAASEPTAEGPTVLR